MSIVGYLLTVHPWPSFLVLLVVVTVLSGIDEDVRRGHGFEWGMWGVSSLAAFASVSYRGMPGDEAAQLGAWVFLGATVGSGFRPGLLTRFPFRNSEGEWLHYANLYIFTGWVGMLWAGSVAYPLLDPYL